MIAFFTWLASFLSGPLLKSGVDVWKAKIQAGTDQEKLATDLAARELLVQQRETELQTQYRIAEIGHWYEPDKLMGYCVTILFGKIVVWDVCLGLGTTDLHAGWAVSTSNLIVMFYFGKRGAENVMRILKRK